MFRITLNPTNTPREFHVETTWKRPFPRRFNVQSTWCVCREALETSLSEIVCFYWFRSRSIHNRCKKSHKRAVLKNFAIFIGTKFVLVTLFNKAGRSSGQQQFKICEWLLLSLGRQLQIFQMFPDKQLLGKCFLPIT